MDQNVSDLREPTNSRILCLKIVTYDRHSNIFLTVWNPLINLLFLLLRTPPIIVKMTRWKSPDLTCIKEESRINYFPVVILTSQTTRVLTLTCIFISFHSTIWIELHQKTKWPANLQYSMTWYMDSLSVGFQRTPLMWTFKSAHWRASTSSRKTINPRLPNAAHGD